MLAEGGQHVARPSGDEHARRVALDHGHRVADEVAPEAGAGGHRQRVVDAGLHVADPAAVRVGAVEPVQGDELVEDPAIEEQAEARAVRAVGYGEEPLARRVDLARLRTAAVEHGGEAVAIGRPGHAAVRQQFEPGIDVGDPARRPAPAACGDLGQALEKDQQPARRAGDSADLGLQGAFGEAVDLELPVGDALEVARREVAQPRPAGHGRRLDAADIAAGDSRRLADKAGRAAEHEDAPGEQPASRPIGEMVGQQVGARAHVGAVHRPAHGNVFGRPGRGSRRDREPGNEAGPRAIREPGKGRAPIALPEGVVIAQGYARTELVEGPGRGETVVPPELRAPRAADERREHAALRLPGVHRGKMPEAPPGMDAEQPGRIVHGAGAASSVSPRHFASVSEWGKRARTPSSVRGTRT